MKFLKPNLRNILLTLALFIAFSWLWNLITKFGLMDVSFYGFPLGFFTTWGPCPPGQNCSEFSNLNFFLDMAIWYVVSAFLVSRMNRKVS